MSNLALTRKTGKKIYMRIPPSTEERIIEICVAQINYNASARLAIRADKDVEIMRGEICTWIPIENQTESS